MSDDKQTPNPSYTSMAEVFGSPLYSDEEVRELQAADKEADLERDVVEAAVALVNHEEESTRLRVATPFSKDGLPGSADTESEEWKRFCAHVESSTHGRDFRDAVRRLIAARAAKE